MAARAVNFCKMYFAMPCSALTFEGFREWVSSDRYPQYGRYSYISGDVYVDILPDEMIVVPSSAISHKGFREWVKSEDFPKQGQISFVEQEIFFDMSPEEIERHVGIKGEVARVLSNLSAEQRAGRFFGSGTLLSNASAELTTHPDGMYVSEPSFQHGRVQFIKTATANWNFGELEGSPDIVVEVVSAGSVRKDTKRLRKSYHRADIPEYWLIDHRRQTIFFDILQWRPEGYVEQPSEDGWQTSAVLGKRFRLTSSPGSMGAGGV